VKSIESNPVYKIIPKLKEGKKDSLGKKQGVFYSYNKNGKVNFIRTYINDTLNGFLGCYSPKGYVNSEQFYKNGERDSLFYEYYKGNVLEKKGYYKKGLKHGIFMEFYENGNLKYEGFYQNDTLIGNEVYYYKNRKIRAIGNKKNGLYKEYNLVGDIESILTYQNGDISRYQKFYPYKLKKLKREKIPLKIINNDSLIINNTNLKVEELYSNYQSKQRIGFIHSFTVLHKDNEISIHISKEGKVGLTYVITKGGIEECYGCVNFDSDHIYKSYDYGAYVEGDSVQNIQHTEYQIIVKQKGMNCLDTGNNPVTIKSIKGDIDFKELRNVIIFNYDSDDDNFNETYIISYESCDGKFRILRVK
tara:strand:- start:90703 stop:91785 length:1083 start_codon:yes stop_codon:yes gene_type:complete